MMYDHSGKDYDVAVSEAAARFQKKLEAEIGGSVDRVQRVIEQVQNDVPDDRVVRGAALRFEVNESFFNGQDAPSRAGRSAIVLRAPDDEVLQLHDNALGQIAEHADVRNLGTVVREMRSRGEWGARLVAHVLAEVYSHMSDRKRFLVRSVRGEARGFLTDAYRRLDSRPLQDAFIGAIRRFGARPMDGFALATKTRLRAILPHVFEPVPGEILAFGASLGDSDFGDGKLTFSAFMRRVWCTNDAETEDVLAKVHLGRRLDERIEFSEKTLELDTRTMASAIADVAGAVLSPAGVNRQLDMVRRASEEKVEPAAMDAWIKKNLTKDEGARAREKFNSPDVETLPKGNTAWRFSNAVSWLAGEIADERRKLELQDLAGSIIVPRKTEPKQAELVAA